MQKSQAFVDPYKYTEGETGNKITQWDLTNYFCFFI